MLNFINYTHLCYWTILFLKPFIPRYASLFWYLLKLKKMLILHVIYSQINLIELMLEREGVFGIIQNFLGTVGEVLSTIIYSLIIVNTGKINIDFKLLTSNHAGTQFWIADHLPNMPIFFHWVFNFSINSEGLQPPLKVEYVLQCSLPLLIYPHSVSSPGRRSVWSVPALWGSHTRSHPAGPAPGWREQRSLPPLVRTTSLGSLCPWCRLCSVLRGPRPYVPPQRITHTGNRPPPVKNTTCTQTQTLIFKQKVRFTHFLINSENSGKLRIFTENLFSMTF